MLTLGLNTLGRHCSVALWRGRGINGTLVAQAAQPMERGHAEALLPMVAALMENAALEFTAIDRVAAARGPGSFTGLRIGLAAARGLALAIGCPAVGISRLEALAADYFAKNPNPAAPLAVVLDARRGQVYLQVFAPGGEALGPARAVDLEAATKVLPGGALLALGDGAPLLKHSVSDGQISIVQAVDDGAARIACIGSGCDGSANPAEPLYLRPPDAKLPAQGVAVLDGPAGAP
ncbi:MAG: tRNA (adenosine(37)-N6)-threonylcarbamoyltransferase complex dimerization subunit type 1 TsaB [Alphaproteobacteria bacterium]